MNVINKIIRTICILTFVMSQSIHAQNTPKLKMGESLPAVVLQNIKNGGLPDLAAYRGKFVLLDFWSRGCASCIASFPDMERLLSKHEDKLAIIPVMKENDSIFNIIARKSQIVKEAKLPFVTADTLLHSLFPHKYVPYYVFVDPNGKFIGSSTVKVTEETISYVLKNGTLNAIKELNPRAPISNTINVSQARHDMQKKQFGNTIYYSAIKKPGPADLKVAGGFAYLKDSITGRSIGFRAMALPTWDIVHLACAGLDISETTDSDDPELQKMLKNQFMEKSDTINYKPINFEIIIENEGTADVSVETVNKCILNELNNEMGVHGTVVKKHQPCYIVKKISESSNNNIVADAAMYAQFKYCEITKYGLYTNDCPFESFIQSIVTTLNSNNGQSCPWYDESGYKNSNTILKGYLKFNQFNLTEINKSLMDYGIQIVQEDRLIPTLMLSQKNAYDRLQALYLN